MDHVYHELDCSLVPLWCIDHIGYDFTAAIEGVSEAVLTQLEYDRGGTIEAWKSGNLMDVLIEKNQQCYRRRAALSGAQFHLHLPRGDVAAQLELHEDSAPILHYAEVDSPEVEQDMQQVACDWMKKQCLIKPLAFPTTKKNRSQAKQVGHS